MSEKTPKAQQASEQTGGKGPGTFTPSGAESGAESQKDVGRSYVKKK